jgi:hypothetical protein
LAEYFGINAIAQNKNDLIVNYYSEILDGRYSSFSLKITYKGAG